MSSKKRDPYKFVAAPGAPFSDEEAAVFGAELLRMSEELGVNGLRFLDKRAVYARVAELPENNALRRYVFSQTDEEAAQEHRVEICARVMRAIRYYPANVSIPRPRPLFVSTKAPVVREGAMAERRAHVFRDDLRRYDSTLVSAGIGYIQRMRATFGQLDYLVSDFPELPPGMHALVEDLRAAFARYEVARDEPPVSGPVLPRRPSPVMREAPPRAVGGKRTRR